MNLFTFLKKRHVFQHIMVILAVIALTPCFASGYSVSYAYWVYAANNDLTNNPIHHGTSPTYSSTPVILDSTASVSGEVTQYGNNGNNGNYGTIQYSANLAGGGVGFYAYAQSGDDYQKNATATVDTIGFSDTLTFFLPEGTYTDDVTVTLSGGVTGSLSSSMYAGANAQYYIDFGNELVYRNYEKGFHEKDLVVGIDETGTINVNDPFAFTKTLVSGGTTLENPREFSYDLKAHFNNNHTWTTSPSPGVNPSAEIDFFNTLQFTDVIVPDGVTWTSESGVFLSETSPPTPVPEPCSMVLLGFGMIGLAGLRKRLIRTN